MVQGNTVCEYLNYDGGELQRLCLRLQFCDHHVEDGRILFDGNVVGCHKAREHLENAFAVVSGVLRRIETGKERLGLNEPINLYNKNSEADDYLG